jgi:TolB-like protein/class 3 adenylate cyclase/Flp pilus assembly protein TadD
LRLIKNIGIDYSLASFFLRGYFTLILKGITEMVDDTTQERRLSAIMFTDMVGYSALAQENESLAVELLEEHRVILRPLFLKHQGREIDIVGDAFFVEFTSALNAVQCAIDIQQKLYERCQETSKENWIRVRIGIHVGDVIHKEKQVIGDCVNIAARMEPLAEPGGICLSEDVARQIYNKIDLPLKSLGKGELKNIRLPMKIYKVVLPWDKTSITYQSSISFFKQKRTMLFIITIAMLICIIGYISIQSLNFSYDSSQSSLAVLPFDNISNDPEQEYFCDGMTEQIISNLAKLHRLKVISRTSIMKFKNTNKTIPEIGKELNVAYVLEGSVRKFGDSIRVTAQLIGAEDDFHLWTKDYDREYEKLFDVQDEVSEAIATNILSNLSPEEKNFIKTNRPSNAEAYDLYLQGRYYWNTRLPQNLMLGMEYFHQAINIDPDYALSYAGLADTYHLLVSYGLLEPKIGFARATEAAIKAKKMDEDLAEAYNSLAAINLLYDWDWKGAEKIFKKALKLNPNYIQTYSWYALYLSVNRRYNEAKSQLQKAIELDPLSPVSLTDLGQVYYHAGKYDQAIDEYHKSLNLDSSYVYTFAYLGQAYTIKGVQDKAEKAFHYAVQLTGRKDPATLAGLAYVYARQKKSDQAKIILEQLENMGNGIYVHPTYLAIVNLALGNRAEALDWLEKGYEDRSEWMIFLQVEHMLDPLRNEERFVELVKKMNFY